MIAQMEYTIEQQMKDFKKIKKDKKQK